MQLDERSDNPRKSEKIRKQVKTPSDPGKVAIDNYLNTESEFYLHSNSNILAHKLSFDTSNDISLYHYTTINSLKLILESRTWLIKQKDYMNDSKEFKYTVKLAETILKSFEATTNEISIFNKIIQSNPFGDAYIWSFTTNRASQTLFGNYSGKKDGVALRFNISDVHKALATYFSHGKSNPSDFTNGDAFVLPLQVIYDKEVQLSYLEPVLAEWLLAYRYLGTNYAALKEITVACFSAITLFGFSFKNPLLRQEEEIRFMVANKRTDDEIHSEITVEGIPYVKCNIDTRFIKEAILQPGNLTSIAELKELLKQYGFGNTIVSKSELPY